MKKKRTAKTRKAAGASPSEALYGFMGWLTSRQEVSGPFSRIHDASTAACLVADYCKEQGFAPPRDGGIEKLKRMPRDVVTLLGRLARTVK